MHHKQVGDNLITTLGKVTPKHSKSLKPFPASAPCMRHKTLVPLPVSVLHMGLDNFKVVCQCFCTEIKWKLICGIVCSVFKHKLYHVCITVKTPYNGMDDTFTLRHGHFFFFPSVK